MDRGTQRRGKIEFTNVYMRTLNRRQGMELSRIKYQAREFVQIQETFRLAF